MLQTSRIQIHGLPFVSPHTKDFLLVFVFFLLCLKSPAALNSCLQAPAGAQSRWDASEHVSDRLVIASQQTSDSAGRLRYPEALEEFFTNTVGLERNLKDLQG